MSEYYAYTCVADRLPHIIREYRIILSVSPPRSLRLMEMGDVNCVEGRGQTDLNIEDMSSLYQLKECCCCISCTTCTILFPFSSVCAVSSFEREWCSGLSSLCSSSRHSGNLTATRAR